LTVPTDQPVTNSGIEYSVRTEYPSGNPGEGFSPANGYTNLPKEGWNPWHPFKNSSDFKAARTLIMHGTSKKAIDSMFTSGLLRSPELSFSSATELYRKMAEMATELGPSSWSNGQEVLGNGEEVFYLFRNPIHIVQYLLRQRAYKEEMVYSPVKEFNPSNGHRLFSEMHTADWWWETQASLPCPNGTVIPLIFGSDTTHLTNFSGGKKAWPVYLTIGNIKSTMRNKPTSAAVIILALLPVPASTQEDRDVIHRILSRILEPLNQYSLCGILLQCSDNLDRRCFLRVAAWIADHSEYCTIYHIKKNSCPLCEIRFDDLGSGRLGRLRDYLHYKELFDGDQLHELEAVDVQPVPNSLFWKIDHVISSNIWKPDKLHVILLGILKHLMEWLDRFLKDHNRKQSFDAVWKTIDPYPGVSMPTKAYSEVSQWQGKEMRSFSRIVYVCLAVALLNPSPSQRSVFKKALACTRSLIDFAAMADYKSHDEQTLSYMTNYLRDFHKYKQVFLQYRAGKNAKTVAKATIKVLRKRLHDEQDTDMDLSSRKRQRIAYENRSVVAEEHVAVLEELSHFNFPKIHLLSHFVGSIRQFGSITMWSTETMESAHKHQVKDGYRASNRGCTYETQAIQHYLRRQTMIMHCLNLTGYARDGFVTNGMADVLDLLDRKMKRLRNQAYKKNNTILVASISRLRPILQCGPDNSHRIFLSQIRKGCRRSTIRSIQDVQTYYNLPNLSVHLHNYFRKIRNIEIPCLTESMDDLQVELYRKLRIPRESLDGELETQDAYATGPKAHYGRTRADWVWYMPDARNSEAYGVLKGHLPAKCLAFLKIRWQSHVYRLVYVRRATPTNNTSRASSLHDLPSVAYCESTEPEINGVKSLRGRACLVRYSPSSKEWLINNRIDLITFNMIY
jgi:hypothetical protein